MKTYENHPAAELLPMMKEAKYQILLKSIRERGLRRKVVLCDGKVLDGRNRLKACLELGVEPGFEQFVGEDPYLYVWDMNVASRDLEFTAQQLAALWIKMEMENGKWQERSEKRVKSTKAKRSKNLLRHKGSTDEYQAIPIGDQGAVAEVPEAPEKPAHEIVSEGAKVGVATAKRVLAAFNKDPEILDKILAGEASVMPPKVEPKPPEAEPQPQAGEPIDDRIPRILAILDKHPDMLHRLEHGKIPVVEPGVFQRHFTDLIMREIDLLDLLDSGKARLVLDFEGDGCATCGLKRTGTNGTATKEQYVVPDDQDQWGEG